MTERMRWAIMGTGAVANRFARALNNLPDQAELLAVGSRQPNTADAFGDKYGIPRRYAGYDKMVADPDVEVVYIGTPHAYHRRDVALCLEAGKHVLCEKAFALNAQEARELTDMARERGLFLMEAMWTRFFPVHVQARDLLAKGALGKVQGLIIHHNYTGLPIDPFDPKLGMGTLLDQGPYGVGLAISLLGPVQELVGLGTHGPTGTNHQTSYVLLHEGGRVTTVASSRVTYDVKEAVVYGTAGRIEFHDPWYKPTKMTVHRQGHEPEQIEHPLNDYIGYEYEAQEVMACIRAGRLESDVMPLSDTLTIMETLDRIREQWVLCPVDY
jgi:predicted dehydrogenase